MKYTVSVTLCEEVHEADTPKEAKQAFIRNFVLGDLAYGNWKIEVKEVKHDTTDMQ